MSQQSQTRAEALERGAKPKTSKVSAWEVKRFFTPCSREEAEAAAAFKWQQWMDSQDSL